MYLPRIESGRIAGVGTVAPAGLFCALSPRQLNASGVGASKRNFGTSPRRLNPIGNFKCPLPTGSATCANTIGTVRVTSSSVLSDVVRRQNECRRHSHQFLGVGPKPLGVTGSPAVLTGYGFLNPP